MWMSGRFAPANHKLDREDPHEADGTRAYRT
jgi:hypothetical protein